jgi:cytochrome c
MRSRLVAALLLSFAAGAACAEPADMSLAKASGCTACHALDVKIVGPSWKDVAARYKGDPNARGMLIGKVRNGSRGVWTEVTGGVPMPPYSPRVSDADIEKLVDFILGLETGK